MTERDPETMPSESKSDSTRIEDRGEGKNEGRCSGERTMGRVCSDDDYDTSSSSYDDVVRIRLGELAGRPASDGPRALANLDGRDGDKMEFQVDSGENTYCEVVLPRGVPQDPSFGLRGRGQVRCLGLFCLRGGGPTPLPSFPRPARLLARHTAIGV